MLPRVCRSEVVVATPCYTFATRCRSWLPHSLPSPTAANGACIALCGMPTRSGGCAGSAPAPVSPVATPASHPSKETARRWATTPRTSTTVGHRLGRDPSLPRSSGPDGAGTSAALSFYGSELACDAALPRREHRPSASAPRCASTFARRVRVSIASWTRDCSAPPTTAGGRSPRWAGRPPVSERRRGLLSDPDAAAPLLLIIR